MAEALQRENELMRELLRRWLDETQWSQLDSGYWDEPDLYVCEWCRESGESPGSIKHASFCLVGQTLKLIDQERHEEATEQ